MRATSTTLGAVVVVTAITVYSVKTAERPVVVDGVIQGPSIPPAVELPRTPADRAEAYSAGLDPAERQIAQEELAAASSGLFTARAAVAVTRDDILEVETNRAAAEHRWKTAMERLYGPTWRAYQQRLESEAHQAAEGAAARYGYPVR